MRKSQIKRVDDSMNLARPLAFGFIILLLTLTVSLGNPQPSQAVLEQGFGLNRSTNLTIKIVFLGINANQLNTTYLTSSVVVPWVKYQAVIAGPLNTGVIYNFNYQTSFADSSTFASFVQYLKSIGQEQNTNATPTHPYDLSNPYFTNSSTLQQAQNYFYNADKVEAWLGSNMTLFGGTPTEGYTLFVADLAGSGIPYFSYQQYQQYNQRCKPCLGTTVTPHYYNTSVTDPDLKLSATRHYMTGWGGSGRFYYMDLSAGPSYWTNELPIQAASQLRGVDTTTNYGRLWVSKFVGDYVAGAVNNLFAADQLYPVEYSQNYNVHLFVIDNRTTSEISQGPVISKTVNRTLIQENLHSLVPYANVRVDLTTANVTAYPALGAIIANSTTSLRDPVSGRPIVDGNLVYRWFTASGLGHLTSFINTTRTTFTIDIPAFLFAFKGNYTFGVPIKEDIGSSGVQRTFAGEALGDMVLIGLSQADFTIGNNSTYYQPGKGYGFTHAATHELGHMLGLNHPFIYDLTEDFTDSVMGYYAYSLNFSQFDRDTILRGVNDELLSFAQGTLSSIQNTLFNAGDISLADQNIARADVLYNTMNYSAAIPYSIAAAQAAYAAQQLSNGIISQGVVFALIGFGIGVGVGILLGYVVLRRKPTSTIQYNRCPTCQQPLRWDPAQTRWYCDRCQKPV
jgi:hypothetical protein